MRRLLAPAFFRERRDQSAEYLSQHGGLTQINEPAASIREVNMNLRRGGLVV
jgi:hypothetical protein